MNRRAAPTRWPGANFGSASLTLRNSKVTVIVTTHFMEEAEYCDRIAILDAGRMLAEGTPASVRQQATHEARRATMEDAFIGIVEQARENRPDGAR